MESGPVVRAEGKQFVSAANPEPREALTHTGAEATAVANAKRSTVRRKTEYRMVVMRNG